MGHERALVSAEPGTTRDFIEERIALGPYCIRLIDTAGLNPAPGILEKRGIEKTMERAAEADLFLWVVDGTKPAPLPDSLRAMLTAEKTICVLNKSDLVAPNLLDANTESPGNSAFTEISVSALTGAGLKRLSNAIVARADLFRVKIGDELIAINARHADALGRAEESLAAAFSQLSARGEIELVASDLRGALDALGEIAGRIDNERMLDHLFATFCIGK